MPVILSTIWEAEERGSGVKDSLGYIVGRPQAYMRPCLRKKGRRKGTNQKQISITEIKASTREGGHN